MPISYARQQTLQGFDSSVTPNWQMVPVGGQRTLTVTGHGTLVPRVNPTNIANVALNNSGGSARLVITGRVAGKGHIEWVPNLDHTGTVAAANKLELSVKAERRIQTAFHYIKDNAGHTTNRNRSDLNTLITGVNAILTTQANVTMVRKSAAVAEVAQNLGAVVRFSSHLEGVAASEHEWDDVTALADSTADFNVFFVWQYEQDATPAVNNTRAGTIASEKNCLMEDTMSSPHAETLAHETVHLLGIADHSAAHQHLIASGAHRNGQLISKSQANTINPSGT
ncbi:hypothetical protein [Labrenzia sp. PHM005]|uniref:hypothetical protein n=1 Tax=Labrenzia sp. PHM005 TaxID=2590016 RepID=UPI0011404AEB|nr:hypothetical protein [Labrenzia sp. PHM005]QDG76883.1 hypothetical protein FJ695_13920 [Labrenzia sp. PHM005]